jgi:hypothetical protein
MVAEVDVHYVHARLVRQRSQGQIMRRHRHAGSIPSSSRSASREAICRSLECLMTYRDLLGEPTEAEEEAAEGQGREDVQGQGSEGLPAGSLLVSRDWGFRRPEAPADAKEEARSIAPISQSR